MKLHEIPQEIVDKISDDFKSTFSQPEPGVLTNLFFERELGQVIRLLKKHIPNAAPVVWPQEEISPRYWLYNIDVFGDTAMVAPEELE